MNKYKELVLNELTNRIFRHPFPDETVDSLVNNFIKVYNLPDNLLYKDGDHIPRID